MFLRLSCAEVWGICFQTEGYVDLIHTTNVRSLSSRLKVNVFVTCKFCAPIQAPTVSSGLKHLNSCIRQQSIVSFRGALGVATGNLSPLIEQQLVECDPDVGLSRSARHVHGDAVACARHQQVEQIPVTQVAQSQTEGGLMLDDSFHGTKR